MPNAFESNLNAVASIMHDNEAAELMTRENPLITIQTLFHNGKFIDHRGRTLLHFAAMIGHASSVKWLLQQSSININAKDNQGQTPLHLSVSKSHPQITTLFLSNKALQIPDKDGDMPMHLLSMASSTKMFRLLHQHKGDVNAENKKGMTAFLCAAAYAQIKFAQWLLDNKLATTNEKDHKGSSAFLYTAVYGQIEFAQWLLNGHYARPGEKNSDGKNAFALAVLYQNIDYVRWLLIEKHIPQTKLYILFEMILSCINMRTIKTSDCKIIQETIDYCIKQNILESLEINFIKPILEAHRAFITPLSSYFENFIQEYINNNNFTVALKLAIIAIDIDPVKFITLEYKVMDIVQDRLLTPLIQKTDSTISNDELLKKAFTSWQEYIDIFKQNNSHGADLLYAD